MACQGVSADSERTTHCSSLLPQLPAQCLAHSSTDEIPTGEMNEYMSPMQGLRDRKGVSRYIKKKGGVIWGVSSAFHSRKCRIYHLPIVLPVSFALELLCICCLCGFVFVFVLKAVIELQRFLLVGALEATQIILKELCQGYSSSSLETSCSPWGRTLEPAPAAKPDSN